jgi:hypothetical protein
MHLETEPAWWLSIPIASENATEVQDAVICIIVCLSFWSDYYKLTYNHSLELMELMGNSGN